MQTLPKEYSPPSHWRKVYDSIVERYRDAAAFWDPRFQAAFREANVPGLFQKHSLDEVMLMLEQTKLKDAQSNSPEASTYESDMLDWTGFADEDTIELFRCSYCDNVSDSLERCSICNASYCDTDW